MPTPKNPQTNDPLKPPARDPGAENDPSPDGRDHTNSPTTASDDAREDTLSSMGGSGGKSSSSSDDDDDGGSTGRTGRPTAGGTPGGDAQTGST